MSTSFDRIRADLSTAVVGSLREDEALAIVAALLDVAEAARANHYKPAGDLDWICACGEYADKCPEFIALVKLPQVCSEDEL
jgi:hypothetical protein